VKPVGIFDHELDSLLDRYYLSNITMNEFEIDSASCSDSMRGISLRHLDKVSNPSSIHGIYPYRGKMSPIDAAHVISQFPPNSKLLDPFCGTGTILYEAQLRGLHVTGVDNNPLACMIARGKTEPLDKVCTLSQVKTAIQSAQSNSSFPQMPQSPARYFHEKSAVQIMRILSASHDFSPFLLACFYGAICLTARACNKWLWTSTSIGKINKPLREIDFYSTLLRKVKKNIDFVHGTPPAKIYTHDTRAIDEVVPPQSIDIVYTSPPYFDALDYTGYYTRLVLEILGVDRAPVRNGLIQRYATYERDMREALQAIDRMVHDKSIIIFVVGNRMVHGKMIRGSEFFSHIAPWPDPSVSERHYTKTASGLWDRINVTSRKEQVVVWDLAKGGRK
jgi:16S rRNA G966 N2-methylase RsmD